MAGKSSKSKLLKSDDFKFKNLVNYIAVILVLTVFSTLQFTGNLKPSYATLLIQIGYSIILAVSLNLVVGFLGELSLGHAGFMCVGAYIGPFLSMKLLPLFVSLLEKMNFDSVVSSLNGMGLDFLKISTSSVSKVLCIFVSMIVSALLAALFGFLVGLPALRLKGDYLAIVTLAFGEIIRNIFRNLPKDLFGGAQGLSTGKVKFGAKDFPLFIIVFVTVLVVLFLVQNLIRSKHGRAITAIRDNEIAAKAMGINVTFYKLFVFVIAAAFAGIAGTFYGHSNTPIIYTAFSYNYSIEILVMVVLGGMGSVSGSMIAATLIVLMNSLLQKYLPNELADLNRLIYAVILIVIVIYNNAPKLAFIKEKFSIKALTAKLSAKKRKPEDILNDPAHWDKIPTKIKMDEVISTDFTPGNEYTPDKPGKGGK